MLIALSVLFSTEAFAQSSLQAQLRQIENAVAKDMDPMRVYLSTLSKDYVNQIAGDTLYRGRVVIVYDSIIGTVGRNVEGVAFTTLKLKQEHPDIAACLFSDETEDAASILVPGNPKNFKAMVLGKTAGGLILLGGCSGPSYIGTRPTR